LKIKQNEIIKRNKELNDKKNKNKKKKKKEK
jgi:hypothetical protein